MNHGRSEKAHYQASPVHRYRGNPFIEALPSLPATKQDILQGLRSYPPKPTDKVRRQGEIVRFMELSNLNDLVIPFPEYERAALALAKILRDRYVACNPMTAEDAQRRHAISIEGPDGPLFPPGWKSTASGHLLLSHSGMGKTTFLLAVLLGYPQRISHDSYKGGHLKCEQIVFLVIRVPHDATLKSLCVQFFEEIDKLLGTQYARQALVVQRVGQMVRLMRTVATATSLGLLAIDELQNLRSATGSNADFMLNLFSEIIESLGISLVLLATPAVQSVIEKSVRNGRKMTSMGETVIRHRSRNDPFWLELCDQLWDYTYTKTKPRLTTATLDAWHRTSAGNTAFTTLSFHLAQQDEIGGTEQVDETSFERVADSRMAFLQPAIRSLLSQNPEQLEKFDDLLPSKEFQALREQLGALDKLPASRKVQEEFEDNVRDVTPKRRALSRGKQTEKRKQPPDFEMALEDPLAMT